MVNSLSLLHRQEHSRVAVDCFIQFDHRRVYVPFSTSLAHYCALCATVNKSLDGMTVDFHRYIEHCHLRKHFGSRLHRHCPLLSYIFLQIFKFHSSTLSFVCGCVSIFFFKIIMTTLSPQGSITSTQNSTPQPLAPLRSLSPCSTILLIHSSLLLFFPFLFLFLILKRESQNKNSLENTVQVVSTLETQRFLVDIIIHYKIN